MWWTEIGLLEELGTFTAHGYGGHAVFVIPGARLVVVHRADTYANRHVGLDKIRTIVRTVLRARTGPPKAKPKLIPMADDPAPPSGIKLSLKQLDAFTGQYQRENLTLTVRRAEDRLEVISPRQGRFFLIPKSDRNFRIEDGRWPLSFTLNSEGQPTGLHVQISSKDKPYAFIRIK